MSRSPSDDSAGADGGLEPHQRQNLSRSTFSGVRWSYLQTGVIVVLQLSYTATMSRLLADEAFGLLALAQLVVNFGQYFAQLGVGRALIQRKHLTDDHVRAAFTSSMVLGSGMTVLVWALAPQIAGIFQEPEFVPVLRMMAVTFVLAGVGSTAQSLLLRELRFRELAFIMTFAIFFGYIIVGIGSALLGGGVYSLVAAVLAVNVAGSSLKVWRARHPMRFSASRQSYGELYVYGTKTSFTQVLEYLGNNLDTFVAGRYFAVGLLGQYNRAFYLVQLPIEYLVQNLSGVLFPSMAKIQDEVDRLRGSYLAVVKMIGSLMVPMLAGLAVAAAEVVEVVLGPGWEHTATAVPLLSGAAAFKVLSRFPVVLAEASNKLNAKLVVEVGSIALFAIALMIAIGGGVRAYAAASLVTEVVRHLAYLFLLRRVAGVRMGDIFPVYGPILLASVGVAAGIAAVRWALLGLGTPLILVLAGEVAAGAVSLVLLLRSPAMRGVRQEFSMRLERAGVLPASHPLVGLGARLLLGPATGSGNTPTPM